MFFILQVDDVGVVYWDIFDVFCVLQQVFWLQFFIVEVNDYYFVVEVWVEGDIMNGVNWYYCCWCINCYVVVVEMIQVYYVIDVGIVWQQVVFNDFYYVIDYVSDVVYVGGNIQQIFGIYVVVSIVVVFEGVIFQWWQWFRYFSGQWQGIQWWGGGQFYQ